MIRIIGDVHGNRKGYLETIDDNDSIQIGDLGFFETHKRHRDRLDNEKHKVLFGNHDDYRMLGQPYSLGDFGMYKGMFFIRGAYSIDKYIRFEGADWFSNEELTTKEGDECLSLYKKEKPDIVITHDSPLMLYDKYISSSHVGKPSYTSQLLDACFEAHKPKLWIHGHHHTRAINEVDGTYFISLGAYIPREFGSTIDYLDLDLENSTYKLKGDNEIYDI